MDTLETDVAVIGAGFGGLSAGLHAADAGARVVVCEALKYPGGCASTFERGGARYSAGATMFAGFGEGQWMRRLVDEHRLDVEVDLLDPVAGFRAPGIDWTVTPDRDAFVEHLASLPGAPPGVRAFFDELRATADTLWGLFDHPEHLPPLGLPALAHHVRGLPGYLPLLRSVGRPLGARLRAHGVHTFDPLRLWLDAVCQITVQTSSAEAEAPVAMAAVDYFFRGSAHVRGGIGALATAMVGGIRDRGGRVELANRATRIERTATGWRLHTRRLVIDAQTLVANLLPPDVDGLLGRTATGRRTEAVRSGWGAAMLYLQVDDDGLDAGPRHLQLVLDPARPLVEGNLVLLSIEPRSETGPRTATVSTHLALEGDLAARAEAVQATMRANLAARAPELRITHEMTASPRTFERFTRREGGLVGGIPRRAGLQNYLDLWPVQHDRGLWLVGDSVFPGQSVLAVAIGGQRAAEAIARAR